MIVTSPRRQYIGYGAFAFPDKRHKLKDDAGVMLNFINQTQIHHHLQTHGTDMRRKSRDARSQTNK